MNTKSLPYTSSNAFGRGIAMAFPVIVTLSIFCCSANALFEGSDRSAGTIGHSYTKVTDTAIFPAEKHAWNLENFYADDSLLTSLTDSIYHSISDDQKVAQLIMPGTSLKKGIGIPIARILDLYRNNIIGGVVFLKGTKSKFAEQIKDIRKLSQQHNILPAIITCDCEPALFHKKFTDADSLTVTSELKTREQAMQSADNISAQIVQMGIQWNFAPVVDVSFNKEVISNRSFGADNDSVIHQSVAFIEQSTRNNIATTLKHFPGHGAVKGDSHRKLVFIDSAMFEVENFKAVISKANPASVMVGHIAVIKNGPYNTGGLPSSISRQIVTVLLKEEIGFKGIAVTDAMNMGAVKNIPEADFKAIKAGIDVVLMPLDPVNLHKRLLMELRKHSTLQEQIIASVKKIIRLKICTGVIFPKNLKQPLS